MAAQRSLDSVLAERAELQLQLAEDRELAALDDSMAAATVPDLNVALRRHMARIAALLDAASEGRYFLEEVEITRLPDRDPTVSTGALDAVCQCLSPRSWHDHFSKL